jgi:hypothetical protein
VDYHIRLPDCVSDEVEDRIQEIYTEYGFWDDILDKIAEEFPADDTVASMFTDQETLMDEIQSAALVQAQKESGGKTKEEKKESASKPLVCARCGTASGQLRWFAGATQVPADRAGARLECLDLGSCNTRSGIKSPTSSSGYSTSSGHVMEMKCRHSASPAFKLGDIVFHGGSESKVEDEHFNPSEWLVVSLLGYKAKDSSVWSKLSGWVDKLKVYTRSPQVVIDWSDMKAPPVSPGFWSQFVFMTKAAGYKSVLFYCIGGHGRTGTALASILIEVGGLSASDAVDWVRTKYCKHAIETQSQVDYLKLVEAVRTGDVVLPEESHPSTPTTEVVKNKKGTKK